MSEHTDPSTALRSDGQDLLTAVRAVAHGMDSAWRAMAAAAGLTLSEVVTLEELYWSPEPLATAVIRRRTGLTAAAVTSLVDRLHQRGLVRRVSLPGDRRRVLIELTAAGSTFTTALFAPLIDLIGHRLDDPGLPEVAVRVQCLEHVAELLREGAQLIATSAGGEREANGRAAP